PPSTYTICLFSIYLISNYLTYYYLLTLIRIPIFYVLPHSFDSSRPGKLIGSYGENP
ncbi:unnamed protein product, partial [Linum tenue]